MPRAVLAAAGTVLALSCATTSRAPEGPAAPRLILIGLDGLDPDLLEELLAGGRMPVLGGLAARGARGELESIDPMISPLLWTTAVTGVLPQDHGITDFVERDASGGLHTVTRLGRRRPALWGILGDRGIRVGAVGFWATWPAEDVNGFLVSDRLVAHGFRANPAVARGLVHPEELRGLVLERVVTADELPADRLAGLSAAGPDAWERSRKAGPEDPLRHLSMAVADAVSLRDATLAAQQERPVEVLLAYFELVDTASHLFMRHRGVPASPHRDTVDRVYELQDELLAPLVALAGPATTTLVVSDHGFRHGADRPPEDVFDEATAVRWHRREGAIVAAGPGIEPGSVVAGSILDVTPTVLALLGVPCARDMPGRPVPGIAAEPQPRIATHGVISPTEPEISVDDREELERLRALGYLAPETRETAASHFNRGRALQSQGRLRDAEQAYGRALELEPEHAGALVNLGAMALGRGQRGQARELFERVLRRDARHAGALNNLALIFMEDRDPGLRARAEELLSRAIESDGTRADARKNLAVLLADRGELMGARTQIESALQMTPEDRDAWGLLAELAAAQGDQETAARARGRAAGGTAGGGRGAPP